MSSYNTNNNVLLSRHQCQRQQVSSITAGIAFNINNNIPLLFIVNYRKRGVE